MREIDISEHMKGICEAFGLDPKNVGRVDFRPTVAVVEVFALDVNGAKYVDRETGEPAMEVRTFAVKT